jgi:hypothetical protein
MENIISYEYHEYPPTQETIGDLNSPNKDVIYNMDVGDEFMHPCNADVYMKYKLLVKDDTEYNDNDEVRVVNNFGCHLWSQILIDKCDSNIDKIDYPGVTRAALGSCLLSNSQAYKYKMSGWETEGGNFKNAKGTKEVLFKLKFWVIFLVGT